ncbi:MAG: sigma-70 family RNA polymerase sigma factor [Thermodesulfobacteriota bacterium]
MSELNKKLHLVKDSAAELKDKNTETENEILLTFEEALTKYLDSLYSTAFELTTNKQEAEDLLQEVCLKAYENFHQLKSGEKAKGWFYRILINTFINKHRKHSKYLTIVDMEVEELFEESLEQYSKDFGYFEDSVFNQVIDEEVEEALMELHVDLRTVVWLSDVEEFTQKEISEMLGCPMGTVASRLHRGRRFLRQRLLSYVRDRGILKK